MPAPLDPYRTLGVAPGASADEIRRAYRQLAKANHPDSAGEAALPRFLAIQTAYEMLITGAAGGRRAASGRAAPGRPAARPAYTRRGGATGGTSGGPSTRPGGGAAGPDPGDGGSAARGGRTAGTTGGTGTGGASERPRRPGGRSRSPNKATLGSTSYDAADDEPFEPDWSGGTWYGASSGTYWTINPKEYADPRKHGPEYQRRARRMIDGVDVDPTDEGPAIAGDDFTDADTETATGGPGRSRFDGRWTYPDEGPAGPGPSDLFADQDAVRQAAPPVDEPVRPSLSMVFDRLLGGQVGLGGRILLAFVGWLPIGAGIAWLAGELTGCGRFTATCIDPSGIGTLIPQLAVIVVLAAVPWLAAISATGTVAALLVSVAVAVVLSAAGGSRQPGVSNVVIALVFVVGYVAGAAFAAGRKLGWRRVP